MTAERLTRLSITVLVAVMLGLALALFLGWDADRTQTCIDRGHEPAWCGWR